MMKIKKLSSAALLAALMLSPLSLQAAEGGSSVYLPGFIGPQAGMVPEAGNYFQYTYYNYDGQVSGSAKRSFALGPGGGVVVTAGASAKLDLDLTANVFTYTHIFEKKLWGGSPGIGIAVPYVTADLTAAGTFTINNVPVVSGRRTAEATGIGDTSVTGLIGWHHGYWHYGALANVYIPTGKYDKNDALNVGMNRWALQPMGTLTYLNETNGIEVSTALGFTFNRENHATNYKSGNEMNLELALIQHLSQKFHLGVVGYHYKQLSGDSGSGAVLGDFKGRINGLGAVIGGAIPMGGSNMLYINTRYYKESGAKNRFEGDALYVSASMKF
jgi:hypothetical protein